MTVNSLLIDGLCHPETKGTKEEWKSIPDYDGIYEASSFGRIRTVYGKTTSNARYPKRVWKSRILKPKSQHSVKRHDLRVTLWKNGIAKDYLVSRLVASAWHGKPDDGMTVNHIDGNYLNNKPENLEWVTLSDNIKHGFKTGLYSSIQQPILLSDSSQTLTFQSMSKCDLFLKRQIGYTSNRLKKGYTSVISKDGRMFCAERLSR